MLKVKTTTKFLSFLIKILNILTKKSLNHGQVRSTSKKLKP